MNIKKQIQNLYMYEVISGFQIVGMVWVYFLLQRGFSLTQAGIAEGFFHVVSMCCEVPSGMVSDTFGRRKTLILSGVLSAVSSLCMIISDFFPFILAAMGLNALSYNFISGTREALTYDSLLEAGEEGQYLRISSTQESIYQGLCGVSSLLSIFIVTLGYRRAYLLSIGQGLLCAFCAFRLQEAQITGKTFHQKLTGEVLCKELKRHFSEGLNFLLHHKSVCKRMILTGNIYAGCYLVLMFMQEHLVDVGLDGRWIGIPLFLISLCSMAGAVLGEKTRRIAISRLILLGGSAVGIFIIFSGAGSLVPAVLAAGIAHGASEMVAIRLANENQKEFSSEIRATMVSMESMVYSIWMAVLSPVIGWAAKKYSISAAFMGLGILVAVTVLVSVLSEYFRKRRLFK